MSDINKTHIKKATIIVGTYGVLKFLLWRLDCSKRGEAVGGWEQIGCNIYHPLLPFWQLEREERVYLWRNSKTHERCNRWGGPLHERTILMRLCNIFLG